jgi:hypothetical protein
VMAPRFIVQLRGRTEQIPRKRVAAKAPAPEGNCLIEFERLHFGTVAVGGERYGATPRFREPDE